MLRRTGFARKVYTPAPVPAPRPVENLRATYAASRAHVAVPKSEPKRNPALLDMAQGRPCLLLFPWVTDHRPDTVVACHSNLSIHGKAGARKADDQYSVWGCYACHDQLDRGALAPEVKLERFMAAHSLQVLEWRRIAIDPTEPARLRKAAQWALDNLNATPKTEAA